jgi:hypothetical protein
VERRDLAADEKLLGLLASVSDLSMRISASPLSAQLICFAGGSDLGELLAREVVRLTSPAEVDPSQKLLVEQVGPGPRPGSPADVQAELGELCGFRPRIRMPNAGSFINEKSLCPGWPSLKR